MLFFTWEAGKRKGSSEDRHSRKHSQVEPLKLVLELFAVFYDPEDMVYPNFNIQGAFSAEFCINNTPTPFYSPPPE